MTNQEMARKVEEDLYSLLESFREHPDIQAKVERKAAQFILDHAESLENGRGHDGLRMSQAGDYAGRDCFLRSYLIHREGVKSDSLPARTILNFQYGDMIEALVLACLDELYGVIGANKMVAFEDTKSGVGLVGHYDGHIKIFGHERVVEIKSINSRGFFEVKGKGTQQVRSGSYTQFQCYLAATGLPGLLISVNKDMGYLHCEFIDPDPQEFGRVKAGLVALEMLQERPKRPYDKPGNFPCMWKTGRCRVYEACWSEGRESNE